MTKASRNEFVVFGWWELGHTICFTPDFINTDLCSCWVKASWSIQQKWAEQQRKIPVGVLLKAWMPAPTTWLEVFPHRERITPLNLLAVCCLMQARKLLVFFAATKHHQAMVNLMPTRDPRSFSDQLLFSQSALSLYQCTWFFFPRCGTSHFLLFDIFLQCFTCSKPYTSYVPQRPVHKWWTEWKNQYHKKCR